jgi:antitoxin component HigA of HigAB toxin-antitoxin module
MGQEILYCFKCRNRIVSADFAEGHAYQVGINASCSACAAEFLQTLGPKDREVLLAKMFKATQGRQKPTGSHPPVSPRRGTESVATPAPKESRALPIGIGVGVGIVAVILIVFLATRSGPDPAPPVKEPAPVVRPVVPPPVPKPAPPPAKEDPLARDRAELEEKVRALVAKEQFQAAIDEYDKVRKLHAEPEWNGVNDQRVRQIRDSAHELFRKEKAKAVTPDQVRALRERVQKWGMKMIIADLPPEPNR